MSLDGRTEKKIIELEGYPVLCFLIYDLTLSSKETEKFFPARSI